MNFNSFIFILIFSLFSSFKIFESHIPSHFPEPYIPESNQLTIERIKLGKKLFFDPILSRDSTISCSTCHNPNYAFSDRKIKAIGKNGTILERNTPTLTNVAYNKYFMLDGVNPTLENQALVPFHEKNEFDLHILIASDRISNNADYVKLSNLAYGTNPNPKVITSAIASYQRTLISGRSKYDQYLNKEIELNETEMKGKNLFYNELHCASCHNGFNFTNYSLTNNGLYEFYADSGRIRLTGKNSDRAIFKVPTLRNIDVTHPYMHDGSINTLEEVILHYMSGGNKHENKHEIIQPFQLNNEEIYSLVSFLKTLTDSTFLQNH